jgi:hypothetical protein
MEGMCTSLANATARISWLPVPGFALQAILGEGASVVSDIDAVLKIIQSMTPLVKRAPPDNVSVVNCFTKWVIAHAIHIPSHIL